MSVNALLNPAEMTGLDGVAHLCCGGEAPFLKSHDAVFAQFAINKSKGVGGRERVFADIETCRQRIATLWQTAASQICFMPSAADAMNSIVSGYNWNSGDNIVTCAIEFPSVGWAWRNLANQGVTVRRVAHVDWLMDEQALLDAVDDNTRIVAVSQVSFYTGQALDIPTLSAALAQRNCLLVVDATHASGVLPVQAPLTDICLSSSYKWMLATTGVTPCYFSERAQQHIAASCFGWRNMTLSGPLNGTTPEQHGTLADMPHRYEPGNPAVVALLVLNNALQRLQEWSAQTLAQHARTLAGEVDAVLRRKLDSQHNQIISPKAESKRSGNTSFLCKDPGKVVKQLANHGVFVWGDNGRIRISTHAYNSSADVDRLATALDAITL